MTWPEKLLFTTLRFLTIRMQLHKAKTLLRYEFYMKTGRGKSELHSHNQYSELPVSSLYVISSSLQLWVIIRIIQKINIRTLRSIFLHSVLTMLHRNILWKKNRNGMTIRYFDSGPSLQESFRYTALLRSWISLILIISIHVSTSFHVQQI